MKALAILMVAIAGALGCNGAIRFDDRPPDAGGATCPNGSCGWESEDCDGAVCRLECRPATTCVGSCGTSCAAECESTSYCALTTGRDADVTCAAGASCTFVLGEHSRVECSAGSTCRVRCSRECLLDCDSATCELQCATGPSMVVSSSASCP